MYYFDHSATTPVHPDVSELMDSIQSTIYGNPSSIYSSGQKAKSVVENARRQIADSISAEPEQIIFTSGGTESNNQVLWCMLQNQKKHVISNNIEHPAVIKVLEFLKPFGLDHTLINVDSDGIISIDNVKKAINPQTSLISLMLANNEIGSIQPIKTVMDIARENNIMVHSDAVQCMGKMELDVIDLGVDFLSLSAHKFYGPKGIGILYAKEPKNMSSLIIGGGQEMGLRAGTENVACIAGMGLAAKLATASIDKHINSLLEFEKQFKRGLQTFFPNAIFNGSQVNKLPGLINVSFPKHRSDILMAKLDRVNIAISNGSACGAGDIKPSPVLSAMGIEDTINLSTLRFSFGKSNTPEQIDYLLNQLKSILTPE